MYYGFVIQTYYSLSFYSLSFFQNNNKNKNNNNNNNNYNNNNSLDIRNETVFPGMAFLGDFMNFQAEYYGMFSVIIIIN